ncbi:hypothetical protein [Sphaerochaeta sp.]|uniref:hypothetical protein n=1 Tax=Sphaerochaeta sp. TaxID=1972642 RepID=UPI003D0E099A
MIPDLFSIDCGDYYTNLERIKFKSKDEKSFFLGSAFRKNSLVYSIGDEQLNNTDNDILHGICEAVTQVCSQILHDKNAYKPDNITFFINKSPLSNASANIYCNNNYYICLNVGLLHYIYKSIAGTFHYSSFMKNIGKSDADIFIYELNECMAYIKHPKCQERLKFVGDLTILSSLLIFYHELAHVLRKHLSYLRDTNNLSIINDGESNNLKSLISKAIESDADFYAGIFIGHTYKKEQKLFKDVFNTQNDQDFFKICTLAAKFTFHIFESKLKFDKYHLPKTRLEILLEGLNSSLLLGEDALSIAIGVVLGVERAFTKFGIDIGHTDEEVEYDGKAYYETTVPMLNQLIDKIHQS